MLLAADVVVVNVAVAAGIVEVEVAAGAGTAADGGVHACKCSS